jgi:PRTRC genetic system protein F
MSNTVAPAALPAATGGLYIPTIDEAVPVRFCKDLQRSQALARFAKASECAGVPLPSGSFLNIEQVVAEQWTQFLASNYPLGIFDGLAGAPSLGVSDDRLEIVINAESRLNAFQLKPVVETLEAAERGLGWFVESVLSSASCHGHQMYDMSMATYMVEVFHHDLEEFSDRGYAQSLMIQNSDEAVPKLADITQEMIDELKEQYSFWPNELLDDVGGHAHLLRQFNVPGEKKPKVMSARQAAKWLKANPTHKLAGAVKAAIQLRKALDKDPLREFVWHAHGYDDDTETMGAMCFLCWDDPQLLFEAVSHYEQNQYNGGQAVEAFARRVADLAEANDEDLQDIAVTTVEYFNRWALLGELLSHFPVWEEDDET